MKLLKNKFFVIVVSVAIVMAMVPTVLSFMGRTDIIRSGLNLCATPFRLAFGWIADGVSGFFEYFSGVDRLIKENESLRNELEEYREAMARAELAEGENKWLRDQMGLVESLSGYTMIDAKVVGRSSNSYSVTYTLNRGFEQGIEVNMAVVTADGIAGYISEVGLGWSRAVAITDPTSAVGVYNTSYGFYGTVEGSVEHRQDGVCIMNSGMVYGGGELLEKGTMLYSGGYGGIFPEGFAVGRVADTIEDGFSHSVIYLIEPAVDFDRISSVMIVTGRSSQDNGGNE